MGFRYRSLNIGRETLEWPVYWKDVKADISAFRVFHADKSNPCKTKRFRITEKLSPYIFYDSSCLTSEGHFLQNVASTGLALYVTITSTPQYNWMVASSTPIYAFFLDCFGYVAANPIMHLYFEPQSTTFASVAPAKVTMSVPLDGGMLLPLSAQEEAHDLAAWDELAVTRLDANTPTPAKADAKITTTCNMKVP